MSKRPAYIIHAVKASSTEPVRVTDHSIASRPKKRLAHMVVLPVETRPCEVVARQRKRFDDQVRRK